MFLMRLLLQLCFSSLIDFICVLIDDGAIFAYSPFLLFKAAV